MLSQQDMLQGNGGLVYASAVDASTYSYTYVGARLAFDGVMENESEIDSEE